MEGIFPENLLTIPLLITSESSIWIFSKHHPHHTLGVIKNRFTTINLS